MRGLPLDEYERRLAVHLEHAAPEAARTFAAATPERRRAACEIVQDKAQTMSEVWPLVSFLFEEPAEDPAAWERVMTADARPALEAALEVLRYGDGFDAESIEAALGAAVESSGRKPKAVYQPIRVAITGTTVSPGIFDSLAALGREEAVARIKRALERLE
jgi:glutamyl-tRNA synthetase